MNWISVIEIIGRIISGVVVAGFVLGLLFHDYHPFFEKMFVYSGSIALGVGAVSLFAFALLGGEW